MSTRQEYVDKVKKQLDTWDQDLQELDEKLHKTEHEFKDKVDHKIQDAKSKFENLKDKLHHLTEATDDAWDDIKDGFEIAWDGVKLGITAARSEFEPTDDDKIKSTDNVDVKN